MAKHHDWQPDVLGAPYQQLTLPLAADDEGDVVATLVRRADQVGALADLHRGPLRGTDVLYVHGWSDYFFQKPLAAYWREQGARFYALDLRKYGRSLRPGQTPGYVTDLGTYDEDIEAALDVMGHGLADPLSERSLILMGHSTGGLTLSLWTARHPERVAALVLNSPWLEFQARALARTVITPIERARASLDPLGVQPKVDLGYYTRSVSAALGGEWEYDLTWRPARGFDTHPGWMAAIFAGQARVAAGLGMPTPALTLLSARSTMSATWSPAMTRSDIVLDVEDTARAALHLGSTVTVARIDGALHDVVLSAPRPRQEAFAAISRWMAGYAPR